MLYLYFIHSYTQIVYDAVYTWDENALFFLSHNSRNSNYE